MSKSVIEWTEDTWNPIVGCSIVSPGCTNCYAMRMAARIEAMGIVRHYDGTTKKVNGNAVWTGKLALASDKTLAEPIRRTKPRMFFVNSMGDLFHEDAPDAWIEMVFNVMGQTPQHTYQILTKRPERMLRFLTEPGRRFRHQLCDGMGCNYCGDHDGRVPWKGYEYPNVWLGTSCERQQEFDERHTWLGSTPAAVRFFSFEPLIGPIDTKGALESGAFHWSIIGGESGPHARPMELAWARSLVDQCKAANVACFMKQLGSATEFNLASKKGGDPAEWPHYLRVRQFPGDMACEQSETAAS
jgi:protein gp37